MAEARKRPALRKQMAELAALYDRLAANEEQRRQRTRLFDAHLEGCLPGMPILGVDLPPAASGGSPQPPRGDGGSAGPGLSPETP